MVTDFCFGAPRCGTTSLYGYLSQHPEICVTAPKEPNFFSVNYDKRDWYYGLFSHGRKVMLDCSTSYSHYLNCPVVERIYKEVPHAKFVYLVRDPLDRLISDYQNLRAFGWRCSFEECVYHEYALTTSLYYFNLQRFLRRFPLDRFLIVKTSDLARDPHNVLRLIFLHLGVADCQIDCSKRHNETVNPSPLLISGDLLERLYRDLSYDWEQLGRLTGIDFNEWGLNPLYIRADRCLAYLTAEG